MMSILPYLNQNGSRDYMKVVVGLPYLWDVRRKARNGCFGPFVSYGYFPSIYRSKTGRKGRREEKQEAEKKKHNIINHTT